MQMKRRIAIIDLDSIIFSIINPNKVLDEAGNPIKEDGKFKYTDKTEEEVIVCADGLMHDILTKCNCTHYINLIKGTNTISFRKEVKSDYKALRPKERPKHHDLAYKYLIDNWNAYVVNDLEVDDMVNIIRILLNSEEPKESYVVAIDKDLLNLAGTNYNWRKNEWKEVSSLEAESYFWSDMIQGQPGDGISGIPGKGPKYCLKVIQEYLSKGYSYPALVIDEYIKFYGEYIGIHEFYKNYKCLKILENLPENLNIDILANIINKYLIQYERINTTSDTEGLSATSF